MKKYLLRPGAVISSPIPDASASARHCGHQPRGGVYGGGAWARGLRPIRRLRHRTDVRRRARRPVQSRRARIHRLFRLRRREPDDGAVRVAGRYDGGMDTQRAVLFAHMGAARTPADHCHPRRNAEQGHAEYAVLHSVWKRFDLPARRSDHGVDAVAGRVFHHRRAGAARRCGMDLDAAPVASRTGAPRPFRSARRQLQAGIRRRKRSSNPALYLFCC